MSLSWDANQRENRCWLFTNGMLIDWGAFLSYQWLSFTNGDHLPVVPLVRVFWRLVAGCVYWTCIKDFCIVNGTQLNLKHTKTETYVDIFINYGVKCSRKVEDFKRNSHIKCMFKIVCWTHNWSPTQTSLWLSLSSAHRRSEFNITTAQGYHF